MYCFCCLSSCKKIIGSQFKLDFKGGQVSTKTSATIVVAVVVVVASAGRALMSANHGGDCAQLDVVYAGIRPSLFLDASSNGKQMHISTGTKQKGQEKPYVGLHMKLESTNNIRWSGHFTPFADCSSPS